MICIRVRDSFTLCTRTRFETEACSNSEMGNSKVFLRGLLNMREEQILTSVIEIQKENWG